MFERVRVVDFPGGVDVTVGDAIEIAGAAVGDSVESRGTPQVVQQCATQTYYESRTPTGAGTRSQL